MVVCCSVPKQAHRRQMGIAPLLPLSPPLHCSHCCTYKGKVTGYLQLCYMVCSKTRQAPGTSSRAIRNRERHRSQVSILAAPPPYHSSVVVGCQRAALVNHISRNRFEGGLGPQGPCRKSMQMAPLRSNKVELYWMIALWCG